MRGQSHTIARVAGCASGRGSLRSYDAKGDAERHAERNSNTHIMHGNAERQADANANCYPNTSVHANFPRIVMSGSNGAAIVPVNGAGLIGRESTRPATSALLGAPRNAA